MNIFAAPAGVAQQALENRQIAAKKHKRRKKDHRMVGIGDIVPRMSKNPILAVALLRFLCFFAAKRMRNRAMDLKQEIWFSAASSERIPKTLIHPLK